MLYSSDWPRTQRRLSAELKGMHVYARRYGGFLFSHFLRDFVLDLLTFDCNKPPRGQFGACMGWGSLRFGFLHLWVSHLSVTVGNSWLLPFQEFICFLFSHYMCVAPLYISPLQFRAWGFFCSFGLFFFCLFFPLSLHFSLGTSC